MFVGLALFPVLVIVPLGLLIWALIDLVGRPADAWARSGQNQLVWALVVVFVGFIGPILYLAIGRPRLQAAALG